MVVESRLCAAILGQLVNGLGANHVVWGNDTVWTGAPQWPAEALRRLEIPEECDANRAFGDNPARLYNFARPARASLATDRVVLAKADYGRYGAARATCATAKCDLPQRRPNAAGHSQHRPSFFFRPFWPRRCTSLWS